jgi:predicted amidohydrolase
VVWDPKGEVIASNPGEGEEVVWADLRKDSLLKVRENPLGFFLNRRRPEIYRAQLENRNKGNRSAAKIETES